MEKASIFGVDTKNQHNHASLLFAWKQSIQQCGFKLDKYAMLTPQTVSNATSIKRSHLFAFRVCNMTQDSVIVNNNNLSSSSAYKMWIKQDFYDHKVFSSDTAVETGSIDNGYVNN